MGRAALLVVLERQRERLVGRGVGEVHVVDLGRHQVLYRGADRQAALIRLDGAHRRQRAEEAADQVGVVHRARGDRGVGQGAGVQLDAGVFLAFLIHLHGTAGQRLLLYVLFGLGVADLIVDEELLHLVARVAGRDLYRVVLLAAAHGELTQVGAVRTRHQRQRDGARLVERFAGVIAAAGRRDQLLGRLDDHVNLAGGIGRPLDLYGDLRRDVLEGQVAQDGIPLLRRDLQHLGQLAGVERRQLVDMAGHHPGDLEVAGGVGLRLGLGQVGLRGLDVKRLVVDHYVHAFAGHLRRELAHEDAARDLGLGGQHVERERLGVIGRQAGLAARGHVAVARNLQAEDAGRQVGEGERAGGIRQRELLHRAVPQVHPGARQGLAGSAALHHAGDAGRHHFLVVEVEGGDIGAGGGDIQHFLRDGRVVGIIEDRGVAAGRQAPDAVAERVGGQVVAHGLLVAVHDGGPERREAVLVGHAVGEAPQVAGGVVEHYRRDQRVYLLETGEDAVQVGVGEDVGALHRAGQLTLAHSAQHVDGDRLRRGADQGVAVGLLHRHALDAADEVAELVVALGILVAVSGIVPGGQQQVEVVLAGRHVHGVPARAGAVLESVVQVLIKEQFRHGFLVHFRAGLYAHYEVAPGRGGDFGQAIDLRLDGQAGLQLQFYLGGPAFGHGNRGRVGHHPDEAVAIGAYRHLVGAGGDVGEVEFAVIVHVTAVAEVHVDAVHLHIGRVGAAALVAGGLEVGPVGHLQHAAQAAGPQHRHVLAHRGHLL